MIYIEKDKEIFGEPSLRVASQTGEYEDSALVEFYDIATPGVIAGAYQAQYVKYGSMVYSFNGHMELGAAILKIDPESTHSSASYVRMSKELLSQINGGSLESTSLEEVVNEEKKNVEEIVNTQPELKPSEVLPEQVPETEVITEQPTEILPEEPVAPEESVTEEVIETPVDVVETIPETQVPVTDTPVAETPVVEMQEVENTVEEIVAPEVITPETTESVIEEVLSSIPKSMKKIASKAKKKKIV